MTTKWLALGEAHGKMILVGEHSVVYGQPAIASRVDRRMLVRLGDGPRHPGDRSEKLERAARVALPPFGIDPETIVIDIDSQIPKSCGLGSSAALSVGLVRAAADLSRTPLTVERTEELATEVENVFHGTSSGLDVAVTARDGVVFFDRSADPRTVSLQVGTGVDCVIGLSGERRSTAGPVGGLRQRSQEFPAVYTPLMSAAGAIAREVRAALATGSMEHVGHWMNVAQGVLAALGVSTGTLEHMCDVARRAGALGAKLTGAGGGGAMIALAPGDPGPVMAALRSEGFESFQTTLRSEKSSREGKSS